MVIEVKDETGIVLGYIIEEDEGDDPMEMDSREVVQSHHRRRKAKNSREH